MRVAQRHRTVDHDRTVQFQQRRSPPPPTYKAIALCCTLMMFMASTIALAIALGVRSAPPPPPPPPPPTPKACPISFGPFKEEYLPYMNDSKGAKSQMMNPFEKQCDVIETDTHIFIGDVSHVVAVHLELVFPIQAYILPEYDYNVTNWTVNAPPELSRETFAQNISDLIPAYESKSDRLMSRNMTICLNTIENALLYTNTKTHVLSFFAFAGSYQIMNYNLDGTCLEYVWRPQASYNQIVRTAPRVFLNETSSTRRRLQTAGRATMRRPNGDGSYTRDEGVVPLPQEANKCISLNNKLFWQDPDGNSLLKWGDSCYWGNFQLSEGWLIKLYSDFSCTDPAIISVRVTNPDGSDAGMETSPLLPGMGNITYDIWDYWNRACSFEIISSYEYQHSRVQESPFTNWNNPVITDNLDFFHKLQLNEKLYSSLNDAGLPKPLKLQLDCTRSNLRIDCTDNSPNLFTNGQPLLATDAYETIEKFGGSVDIEMFWFYSSTVTPYGESKESNFTFVNMTGQIDIAVSEILPSFVSTPHKIYYHDFYDVLSILEISLLFDVAMAFATGGRLAGRVEVMAAAYSNSIGISISEPKIGLDFDGSIEIIGEKSLSVGFPFVLKTHARPKWQFVPLAQLDSWTLKFIPTFGDLLATAVSNYPSLVMNVRVSGTIVLMPYVTFTLIAAEDGTVASTNLVHVRKQSFGMRNTGTETCAESEGFFCWSISIEAMANIGVFYKIFFWYIKPFGKNLLLINKDIHQQCSALGSVTDGEQGLCNSDPNVLVFTPDVSEFLRDWYYGFTNFDVYY